MSKKNLKQESKLGLKGPIESEYIRISETKAFQLKIWDVHPSKFDENTNMPAYVEIEEVRHPKDGDPVYGPSIHLSAVPQTFALAEYLMDFLKKARKINRDAKHS